MAAAPVLPTLRGPRVTLRPATMQDVPRLHAILREPAVSRWWGHRPVAELVADLAGDDVHCLVIEVQGRSIGLLQYHEETEPDYHSAGMDIALSGRHQGQGLGPEALALLAQHLFSDSPGCGHHRVTIDPAAGNERAIAAYRRVGFQPVGIMRRYERGNDGTWHDGLLMDLLKEEFVPPWDAAP